MMSTRRLAAVLALGGFLGGGAVLAGDHPAVPYPEGYRRWTFLHSTILGPQHGSLTASKKCEAPCTGGVMYFYANAKAMKGLETGKFADGSVLADEVLELHGTDNGGAKEGPRRGVGVMVKDAKLYAATGGWGYGTFNADSKVEGSTVEQKQACFQCHVAKKDQSYVFSLYRER